MPKKTKKTVKKKKKLYFGPETDSAINRFQSEECHDSKKDLYVINIKPAFEKLVENLIFIHGFANSIDTYEVLKQDCVTFLYETLHKFDGSRGTKAFSYFNVVAKNWLIIRSKKFAKNRNRNVSYDTLKRLNREDRIKLERAFLVPSPESHLLNKEIIERMHFMFNDIMKKCKSDNEIACMKSIQTLFINIDDLEFLNKRAIFVYMRDLSGLNAKQLSVAMSSIRKYYKEIVGSGLYQVKFKEE